MSDLRDFSEDELRKELERRSAIWIVVDLCHSYFCNEDHNSICNYYNERQLIDTFEQPNHQKWLGETEKRMELYGFSSSKPMLHAFNECAKPIELYAKMTKEQRQLFHDIVSANF
jgi:hypothetical protein